jgi:3-hydroxy acid dehydrogenase/malonic semialdehyde reductase
VRRADQLVKVAEAASTVHKSAGIQQGGQIVIVQLDMTDLAQVSELWTKVLQNLCNVDILGKLSSTGRIFDINRSHLLKTVAAVNNTGGAHGIEVVGNIQDKDIDTMFVTNVFGLISITQLLIKGLSAAQHIAHHLTVSIHSLKHTHLHSPPAARLKDHNKLQSPQHRP